MFTTSNKISKNSPLVFRVEWNEMYEIWERHRLIIASEQNAFRQVCFKF